MPDLTRPANRQVLNFTFNPQHDFAMVARNKRRICFDQRGHRADSFDGADLLPQKVLRNLHSQFAAFLRGPHG